jgi:hypothetical protein
LEAQEDATNLLHTPALTLELADVRVLLPSLSFIIISPLRLSFHIVDITTIAILGKMFIFMKAL